MEIKSGWLRRKRRLMYLTLAYAVTLSVSLYLAYELRFDFAVPLQFQHERMTLLWPVMGVQLLLLIAVRQLDATFSYFSIPDLKRILFAMTAALVVLLLVRTVAPQWAVLPRGVLLIDYVMGVAGLCTVRLAGRLYRERITISSRLREAAGPQANLAIIGAGDAGAALARDFLNTPARGFRPVAFLDDDRTKYGLQIHGVPIFGAPEALLELVKDRRVTRAVIAMPSAPKRRIREIVTVATAAGVTVETLPAIEELASGRVRISQIRPVEIQDLLGRDPVNLESDNIRAMIAGKVVMVTGAGGSIGSELCRQIAGIGPARLLMVEQAEGSLFYAERDVNGLNTGTQAVPLVADINDGPRMRRIFEQYQPALVYHAAAHKHVYMMERQPVEAVTNNALGTRRLARLAVEYGVEAFVLISTDKAINPTSVMGASKRLAELELQRLHTNGAGATKLMAVRFGNVLGSSGSVIPIFKEQIAKGGPVTVTHPEVTRYFMTIPEAVGLVLQCGAQGAGGEIFVLDMGQPIKILDLARQMIALSGLRENEDIEIRFTGLKQGEKLFEELQHQTEKHENTRHPRIVRFVANGCHPGDYDLEALARELHGLEATAVKRKMRELVPEYTPQFD